MDVWQAIWQALGPALVLSAYVLGGLAVYAARRFGGWRFRDPDLESRGATMLLPSELRLGFAWLLQPVGHALRWSDVPAAALTTLSVALAAAAAVALATGRFALGGWLAIAGGLCDFFDGRVARARGESGPWGAALDSILDRYSDALLMTGLAWYWRDTWLLAPALMGLSGALLVSYVRARSEAVGLSMRDGLMQRAERIACLGVTTALTPVFDLWTGETRLHWLAAAGVLFVAIASHVTAAGRFRRLLLQLGAPATNLGSWRTALGALAIALDFALVALLVDLAHLPPWAATGLGQVVGAGMLLLAGRALTVYRRANGSHGARRRIVGHGVALVLNAGGVALLAGMLDWHLAWVLVRAVVLMSWNRTLARATPPGAAIVTARAATYLLATTWVAGALAGAP